MQKLPVLPTTLPLVTASAALPLLRFNVLQIRLLTGLVKTLGRPNKAVGSGRIVARLIEWHLAGGAQPLAVTMNDGVCLAVEVDPHHIQRRLETSYCDEMASTLDEALHQVREAVNRPYRQCG